MRKESRFLKAVPQPQCTQHESCRNAWITLSQEDLDEYRSMIKELKPDIFFFIFQSWPYWPKSRKNKSYYSSDGRQLTKNRYPRTTVYKINRCQEEIVVCINGLCYIFSRGKEFFQSLTGQVYRFREDGQTFGLLDQKRGGSRQRLVVPVKEYIEKNFEIRKGHYAPGSQELLYIKPNSGDKLIHYASVYNDYIKETQPQVFAYKVSQQKLKIWKMNGRITSEKPEEVEEHKGKPTYQHFIEIVKKVLKLRLKTPEADRCDICAEIKSNIAKNKDNPQKFQIYQTDLDHHLRFKKHQKRLLRSCVSLVDPYSDEEN